MTPRLRRTAAALGMVLLAGCGTRLEHADIVTAQQGVASGVTAPGAGAANEGSGAGAGLNGVDATPRANAASGAPRAATGGTAATTGGSTAGKGTAGKAVGGRKSTIVLGNVGSYSGLGSTIAPARTMIQVWAQSVNDAGGINGHPVKVITADDGGDTNRSLALVKDMVENQKVLAFVGNQTSLTVSGYLSYLEGKKIPVIGGDVTSEVWNNSPVLFPEATAIDSVISGTPATAARAGLKKLGLLYCAESDSCTHVYDYLFTRGQAKKAGIEPAYSAQVSIAQPDFTAECIQARNAGVDALYVASDANSLRRVAASCGRQGYHPTFLGSTLTLGNELPQQPELEGMLGTQGVFPWFAAETPATAASQAAVKKYAPGLAVNGSTAQAWVSGKLFEKAATRIGDVPTLAAIYDGLYALHSETLNGLAPPLTFKRDAAAPAAKCYFVLKIHGGKWITPQGQKVSCQP